MRITLALLAFLLVLTACMASQSPRSVPTKSNPAVVKVSILNGQGEVQGFCTAWKLGEDRMATAGHCCVYEEAVVPEGTSEEDKEVGLLLGLFETKEVLTPLITMEGPMAIPGETATVIRRDADHDICILKGHMRGNSIRIASHDPVVGEKVWTAGYPHTTFLISEGIWSGREENMGVASVAVWGGASGSPVMDPDGNAVGVLVAAYKNFDSMAFIAPVEWLTANSILAH